MTTEVQPHEGELEPEYQSLDYWKPHFDEKCTVSLEYYTVDDGSKILTAFAKNDEYPDNKPVIIIPGWFSLIFGWSQVTQEISKYTSILYIESREKSSSILPNHDVKMSVQRMADDLTNMVEEIPVDITNSIVIASSMGGTLMLEYLGRMKQLPHTSVLIGPNPEFEVPNLLTKAALKLPLFVVNSMKWFIKFYIKMFRIDMDKEPQQFEKYSKVLDNAKPWKIRQSARECLWYEAWDLLEKATIDQKVILVGASADKMHNATMTQEVHEVIKGSEYVDFPSNKATHSKEMGQFIVGLL